MTKETLEATSKILGVLLDDPCPWEYQP